ncbi:MAG: nucleotidyltransferase family protein [Legionella sp.]|nr:nucleotidyltransferase family protein [Legionella sp.]
MKTAMILAAGRGERLKEITHSLPKALCPVNKMPLIEHHINKLAGAGFNRIIINHAYLGGQIRQYLGNGTKFGIQIVYSPEPPGGLETGGGITKALPLLGKEPFITVNADIYTDFDFRLLDLNTVDLIHLILVKNNPGLNHPGDFGLMDNHCVTNTNCVYTFSGIACYHPKVFTDFNKPGRFSMLPLLRKHAQEKKITGSLHAGCWFDIGSPIRLKAANEFVQNIKNF